MSSPALEELEDSLLGAAEELAGAVECGDGELAEVIAGRLRQLLEERNRRCRALK